MVELHFANDLPGRMLESPRDTPDDDRNCESRSGAASFGLQNDVANAGCGKADSRRKTVPEKEEKAATGSRSLDSPHASRRNAPHLSHRPSQARPVPSALHSGGLATSPAALVTIPPLPCGLAVLPAEDRAADIGEWRSAESPTRPARAARKTGFFPLGNDFIGWDNAIFRGPVPAAVFLDDRTRSRPEVPGRPLSIGGAARSDSGLPLRQLAQMPRSHGLKAVVRVVDEGAETSAIRRETAANLAATEDFVPVNCALRAFGQQGGGHISPLGAHDPASDSFLVMDANPSRAPWVRVPAADPIAAMRAFDTVENRGYMPVSEGRQKDKET